MAKLIVGLSFNLVVKPLPNGASSINARLCNSEVWVFRRD